jgi:hypothetical protein
MEVLRPAIKSILYGTHAHIDPRKVLHEITPKIARRKLTDNAHSCWQLLYHMNYWQDVVVRAYDGDESTKEANDQDSWPKPKQMKNDSDWTALVNRFEGGLEQLATIAEERDLMQTCATWPDAPLLYNLMVEVAHNSYHLGQMVLILRSCQSQGL